MTLIYNVKNLNELKIWVDERNKIFRQIISCSHTFIFSFRKKKVILDMIEFQDIISDLEEVIRDAKILLRSTEKIIITSDLLDFTTIKNKAESAYEDSLKYKEKWNYVMTLGEKARRIIEDINSSEKEADRDIEFDG